MTRHPISGSKSERLKYRRLVHCSAELTEKWLYNHEPRIRRLLVDAVRRNRFEGDPYRCVLVNPGPVGVMRRERRRLGRQSAQSKCRRHAEYVALCVSGLRWRARRKLYGHTGALTFANVLKDVYSPERVESLTFRPSPWFALVEKDLSASLGQPVIVTQAQDVGGGVACEATTDSPVVTADDYVFLRGDRAEE